MHFKATNEEYITSKLNRTIKAKKASLKYPNIFIGDGTNTDIIRNNWMM